MGGRRRKFNDFHWDRKERKGKTVKTAVRSVRDMLN
jgi:hypothetical protein